jgi:DNA-binding transcriptional ArsR family regulator
MVVYEFGVEDLARTRFAISPLFELTQSLRTMVEPARLAYHEPWVDHIRGKLGGIDLIPAIKLIPHRGYVPDFIAPPPREPYASIETELERVRQTPVAQVRRELGWRFPRKVPPELQPMMENTRRELNRMCDVLSEYWERALKPHWPRVSAFLRADIQHRAARQATGGAASLFGEIHPHFQWKHDRLEVVCDHEDYCKLDGQGLLLIPSAFAQEKPLVLTDEAWEPTVVYPARAIATLWQGGVASPEALATLVGSTRARLLESLEAPRSTTELATRLEVSTGGVSQHLGVLGKSGLVTAERSGRSVLYVRTPLADRLVRGDSAE